MNFDVHGEFNIKLFDRTGNLEKETNFSNLITDYGLDTIGLQGIVGLRDTLAFSTDSSTPSFSDSTITNEVARTTSSGNFSNPSSIVVESSSKLEIQVFDTKFLEFSNSANITKLAYLSTPSSSNPTITELIKDTNGNPIQLTILEGKQLLVTHKLTISVTREVEDSSFSIVEKDQSGQPTGNSVSITSKDMIFGNDPSIFLNVLDPNSSTYLRFINSSGQDATISGSVTTHSETGNLQPQPYISGSFTREKKVTIPTHIFGITIYGFVYGGNDSGYKRVFQTGDITKTNLKNLSTGYSISWNRV